MIEGHDYTIYSNGPSGRAGMYAFLALITAFLTPLTQHGGLVILRRYWQDDWDAWQVTGHFFDDIGRSGQISLRQGLAGIRKTTAAQSPPTAASRE
jgi:hypothetical protein